MVPALIDIRQRARENSVSPTVSQQGTGQAWSRPSETRCSSSRRCHSGRSWLGRRCGTGRTARSGTACGSPSRPRRRRTEGTRMRRTRPAGGGRKSCELAVLPARGSTDIEGPQSSEGHGMRQRPSVTPGSCGSGGPAADDRRKARTPAPGPVSDPARAGSLASAQTKQSPWVVTSPWHRLLASDA